MKQQLNSDDIARQAVILQQLLQDAWLHNVYDGHPAGPPKTIIFKFHHKEGKKIYLLIEAGKRIHTLPSFQACRQIPSGWVALLRKYLRHNRLLDLRRCPGDRVVDLVFYKSQSENQHLLAELYDRGNFLLTDSSYQIMAMSRVVPYQIGDQDIKKGASYPVVIDQEEEEMQQIVDLRGYLVLGKTFGPVPSTVNPEGKVCPTLDQAIQEYFEPKTHVPGKENVKSSKKKKGNARSRKEHSLLAQLTNFQGVQTRLLQQAEYLELYRPDLDTILQMVRFHREKGVHEEEVVAGLTEQWPEYQVRFQHPSLYLHRDDIKLVLDPSLTVYQNLAQIHDNRKKFRSKESRAAQVLKDHQGRMSNEKEVVTRDHLRTDDVLSHSDLHPIERRKLWFEKYWWFIAGQYLICCGKSADDNEELLKRITPQDLLVHGDFDKSPWGLVRRLDPEVGSQQPDPQPETPLKILRDAGDLIVQRSWHWLENVSSRSYYTFPDKISKSAPSGEFLTKGARMVHQKEYLPITRLEMGVAILFRQAESYLMKWPRDSPTGETDYDALVVCGPYTAFRDYQFRLKVKPSGSKREKGRKKLIQKIIGQLLQQAKSQPPVRSLIQSIPYEEWDGTVGRHITL